MSSRYSQYIKYIHAVGDILILNLSFTAAFLLKFRVFNPSHEDYDRFNFADGLLGNPYFYSIILFNIAWIVLVVLFKPYKISRISRLVTVLRNHLTIIIIHLLAVAAFWFLLKSQAIYSREQFFTSYLIFTILLFSWKIIFHYLLRAYRKQGFNFRRVVVVGYGDLSLELQNYFSSHPEFGFKLLGFFDMQNSDENKILGNYDDIESYVLNNDIDDIYCCLPYVEHSFVKKLIDFGDSNLIKIKLLTDFRGFSSKSITLERYDAIPVLNVSSTPLDESKNMAIKRTFDVLFSSVIFLFVFSWLFPLIALLIKLDSKGPVFFKQMRRGKDGKEFGCYKFRSMYITDNDEFKLVNSKNDSRITKIGAFLRKTSLDELPQFLNVFFGQMAVVGPRPHALEVDKVFKREVDKYMTRYIIKPGITGLAQIKGFRGNDNVFMQPRVKLDRFYSRKWSMVLDFKIIFLTMSTLMKGDENAY